MDPTNKNLILKVTLDELKNFKNLYLSKGVNVKAGTFKVKIFSFFWFDTFFFEFRWH